MATYEIEPASLERVLDAIRAFLIEIGRNESATEYTACQLSGTYRFVHLMSFPDEEAEQRHRSSPWTKAFVEVLYPLCREEPRFSDLERIEAG